MVGRVIEGTITLVITYLVLTNAQGFSSAAQAIANGYVGSVKALQGR